MTRCVKDKVPQGSYVVRASILDRLVDNKVYYKIIEHGNKIKAELEITKELAQQLKKDEEDKALSPKQVREDTT